MSPETKAAVESWQRAHGLLPDGVIGDKTWLALNAALRAQVPPHPLFTALSPVDSRAAFGDPLAGSSIDQDGTFKPNTAWAAANIVPVAVSVLETPTVNSMPSTVFFHKKAADPFRELWRAWRRAGLFGRILCWSGSLAYRVTRRPGSQRLSQHAYGVAFDINAPWCPMGDPPKDATAHGSVVELVTLAQGLGWYWGGWFNDAMHFEFSCP